MSESPYVGLHFKTLGTLLPKLESDCDELLDEVAKSFMLHAIASINNKPIDEVSQGLLNGDEDALDMLDKVKDNVVDVNAFNHVHDLLMSMFIVTPAPIVWAALGKLMYSHLIAMGELNVKSESLEDRIQRVVNEMHIDITNFLYKGEDES